MKRCQPCGDKEKPHSAKTEQGWKIFRLVDLFGLADSVCLLDAFFAETCSLGRSLAGLELGVALANDIQGALALDDLAVFMALLHGQEG